MPFEQHIAGSSVTQCNLSVFPPGHRMLTNNSQTLYRVDRIVPSDRRVLPPNISVARPFTPGIAHAARTILQPRPQRPIPIEQLTHASRPAHLVPVRAATSGQEIARQTHQRQNASGPSVGQAPTFQFPPGTTHARATRAPEIGLAHPIETPRSLMPLSNAVRNAKANQQSSARVRGMPFELTSPEHDNVTDSGYGQFATFHDQQSTSTQPHARTNNPAPLSSPQAPSGGFVFYCATGTQEPPKPRTNTENKGQSQASASVWNPTLANCTATKPRRLTLKQENDFEEADRRYQSEAMRNSITVVKDTAESKNKPVSAASQR